jgi:hypothetical protein
MTYQQQRSTRDNEVQINPTVVKGTPEQQAILKGQGWRWANDRQLWFRRATDAGIESLRITAKMLDNL